jgi:beta-lactamase class A
MLTKRIPLYYLLITLLLGGTAGYYLIHTNALSNIAALSGSSAASGKTQQAQGTDQAGNESAKNSSSYDISSQKGYELIKPLLWAKPMFESNDYASMKASLSNLIEDNKASGALSDASVYFVNLNDGAWTYVNPDANFHPASLIKVPLLITYLHEAEKDQQLLNKKVVFEKPESYVPTQYFNSETIQPGHTYTISELLKYMIVYSDNNATNLLNQHVDLDAFRKTFSDLDIPEPDLRDPNFQISARRYSRFILVLYNASYLSKSSSELAMQMLTECSFKDGMVKDLPSNMKVAHKFGEWGNNATNSHELHESGIVYVNDKPYLLTVMTKGTNAKQLGDVIGKLSKQVYDVVNTQQIVANKPNL